MIALANILVATDFSEPSTAAIAYARDFARQFSATLHVLHVADDLMARAAVAANLPLDLTAEQDALEADATETLNRLVTDDDRRTLKIQTSVTRSATPGRAIVAYAEDHAIDLIVVGTHGRTGLSHFFLGSVAQYIVRSAPCPVLTVRHPEREFLRPDALQAVTAPRPDTR